MRLAGDRLHIDLLEKVRSATRANGWRGAWHEPSPNWGRID